MPDDILACLNTHVPVSRETYERLCLYHDLLLKWQAKINLIGPDTTSDVWSRHFLDSLQLLKHIPSMGISAVDFGSGAGFPGMALAIAGVSDMHLVESDAKKVAFLKEVARITQAPVTIHHGRIEDHPICNVDVITSRACASLTQLLTFSYPCVSRETLCLFHKGKNYYQELLDAGAHWLFDYRVIPSAIDTQSVILEITHLRKLA